MYRRISESTRTFFSVKGSWLISTFTFYSAAHYLKRWRSKYNLLWKEQFINWDCCYLQQWLKCLITGNLSGCSSYSEWSPSLRQGSTGLLYPAVFCHLMFCYSVTAGNKIIFFGWASAISLRWHLLSVGGWPAFTTDNIDFMSTSDLNGCAFCKWVEDICSGKNSHQSFSKRGWAEWHITWCVILGWASLFYGSLGANLPIKVIIGILRQSTLNSPVLASCFKVTASWGSSILAWRHKKQEIYFLMFIRYR